MLRRYKNYDNYYYFHLMDILFFIPYGTLYKLDHDIHDWVEGISLKPHEYRRIYLYWYPLAIKY